LRGAGGAGLAGPALRRYGAGAFRRSCPIGDGVTFDPMLDARLRWEDVDAATKAPMP
jgi:hypothetical protein